MDTASTDAADDDWQTKHDELLAGMRPHGLAPIYHYTSVAGALAILTTQTIWLSSAATMNDHAEGKWLEQRLLDHETERAMSMGQARSLDESEAMRAMWQLVFSSALAPQAYLACFSAAPDMLSQWRAYADDGQGIAIGFDPNDGRLPIVQGPPHSNIGPGLECTLSEVRYLDDPTAAQFVDLLEVALATGIESSEFFNAQLALSAARWRTKNPAFMEEREWRIVNLPHEFDHDIGGGNTAISIVGQREFRSAAGRLTSYYAMPFGLDAVCEIVLGPRCAVDERELALLLRQHGYDGVTVRRSSATYRR